MNISDMSKNILNKMRPKNNAICHYVFSPTGYDLLDEPVKQNEHVCKLCGKNGMAVLIDPATSDKRAWLCENVFCDVYTKRSQHACNIVNPPPRRAIEWPLFCEINSIGDKRYDVRFADIKQTTKKIEFLREFAKKPSSTIILQGPGGTGKTYAAMAVCEQFTKTDAFCVFTTQARLQREWVNIQTSSGLQPRISELFNCKLLVIDDIGISLDVSSKFMGFFMELIDTRTAWTDRGTILTTNLDNNKFLEQCGEALTDRLKTGQKMIFDGKSRR